MQDFVEEDKYWRALQVGDTIYDEQGRGGEFDYHKMIIDEIDLKERTVKAHDAVGDHKGTLAYFLTQAEFERRFNPLIRN